MGSLATLAELLESDRYSRKTLADGSGVLLDSIGLRVLSLNRTGMFVLEEIAGGTTHIERLEQRLAETFEVDRETAARDLERLIRKLDRLLATPDPSECA